MTSKKAVVLFSGGQDSTTCLAQALHDFPGQVVAVCFDFGQRHRVEIEQAQKIAALANVPLHVMDLTFLGSLHKNALTSTEVEIIHEEGTLPSTFVPGRNLVFLVFAAIYAYDKGIRTLYTGVCETDYSGYPDCRHEFIQSAQKSISLALDEPFEIRTPLMWISKADTVKLMQTLGHLDWYAHTHTCYEGARPACGKCPACILRLRGFAEAGVPDPLAYR